MHGHFQEEIIRRGQSVPKTNLDYCSPLQFDGYIAWSSLHYTNKIEGNGPSTLCYLDLLPVG
jgi:hypothetical protein